MKKILNFCLYMAAHQFLDLLLEECSEEYVFHLLGVTKKKSLHFF